MNILIVTEKEQVRSGQVNYKWLVETPTTAIVTEKEQVRGGVMSGWWRRHLRQTHPYPYRKQQARKT